MEQRRDFPINTILPTDYVSSFSVSDFQADALASHIFDLGGLVILMDFLSSHQLFNKIRLPLVYLCHH